ncbi:signal peptidase II [Ancylothrix sp. C2]|uniref:signal peptidase II n=1 Tax=Ancylothrix sp. D3o TaxID=2953691 RepID=UPI0021BA9EF9|nr:signal peptidase II [Ancylothrix sp. D3o]MCT7950843.1 signal peptidase II [Ancylothrix sp. D3o]
MIKFKNRLFWIVAFFSLAIDHLTKLLVVQNFKLGESWPLIKGVFHFTYVTNPGAAFSLFSQNGGWLRWLSLGVSLAIMAYAGLGPRLDRWEQIGFGFILGGALGNGIDRFLTGEVVDFLDFRLIRFPVFNLADVFINIGIVCLLLVALQQPPAARKDNGGSL